MYRMEAVPMIPSYQGLSLPFHSALSYKCTECSRGTSYQVNPSLCCTAKTFIPFFCCLLLQPSEILPLWHSKDSSLPWLSFASLIFWSYFLRSQFSLSVGWLPSSHKDPTVQRGDKILIHTCTQVIVLLWPTRCHRTKKKFFGSSEKAEVGIRIYWVRQGIKWGGKIGRIGLCGDWVK